MKRFIAIALVGFACTEPERLPVDAGFEDVGPKDAAPDSGSDAGEDASVEDAGGGDAAREDTGVTPTGICENRPCLTSVGDDREWSFVSGPSRGPSRCDLAEETLFALPRNAGTAIAETIYADAEAYDNLYFFLEAHFANELPDLDPAAFFETFERSDTREYWTGRIFRTGGGSYGFDVEGDFYFGSPPDAAQLEEIRTALMQTFGFTLAYAPQESSAIGRAEQFQDPPFEVLLPEPCAGEGCADPDAFCVVVPEATELCGHFAEGRDVPGELAAKIRLDILPGNYEIPREVGTMPMRLIAGGSFGSDRMPIDASEEGTLTVQDVGGYLYYQYAQRLTAGADLIEINWDLDSTRSPLILREPFLTEQHGYGVINGSQMFPDGQIVAGSCTAGGLSRYFAEGELGGGDSFRFTYRHRIPFAGSGPLFLTGATVTLGGQTASVGDYFDLVYAGEHHNWDNQFVIIFDAPMTYMGHDVHGIWIDEPPTTCCPVETVHTLDASYQKLDQLPVTSYVRSPSF
jgi:hypothetical protein